MKRIRFVFGVGLPTLQRERSWDFHFDMPYWAKVFEFSRCSSFASSVVVLSLCSSSLQLHWNEMRFNFWKSFAVAQNHLQIMHLRSRIVCDCSGVADARWVAQAGDPTIQLPRCPTRRSRSYEHVCRPARCFYCTTCWMQRGNI